MVKIRTVPPVDAPEAARALAGEVEVIGRLYVLRCPVYSSQHEREKASELLKDTLKTVHDDGSPYSWLVLPEDWSIEACEVDPQAPAGA